MTTGPAPPRLAAGWRKRGGGHRTARDEPTPGEQGLEVVGNVAWGLRLGFRRRAPAGEAVGLVRQDIDPFEALTSVE
jgi:hypothetical protein